MAALTFSSSSSITHCSSSSTSFLLFSPKTTPHLSFHSQFNLSSSFRLVSSKSKTTTTITKNNNSSLRRFTVVSRHKKLSQCWLHVIPDNEVDMFAVLQTCPCIFAIHDKNGDIQLIAATKNLFNAVKKLKNSLPELCHAVKFIAATKNLYAAVKKHKVSVPELCHAVKYLELELDEDIMWKSWQLWLDEYKEATGKVPPGNDTETSKWIPEEEEEEEKEEDEEKED